MSSGVTIDEVYSEIKKIRAEMVRREDVEALVDTLETGMNRLGSLSNHENLLHTIDSRFRASARHGGAGSCFEFAHRSAAGASLRGRRQSSYLRKRVVTIPVSYLNKTIFMGNPEQPGDHAAYSKERSRHHLRAGKGNLIV
jgi:hypothetical protein